MYSLAQNHIYSGFSLCLSRRALSDVLGGCFLGYCCCLVTKFCPALCDPMDCNMPGLPVLHYLPEFVQTHVHWISDAIQPSCPLSSPSPPAFPSIRVFSNESVLHIRWLKYWSFSFSISLSDEYLRLISFSINWFDPLIVQESQESSPTLQFQSITLQLIKIKKIPHATIKIWCSQINK